MGNLLRRLRKSPLEKLVVAPDSPDAREARAKIRRGITPIVGQGFRARINTNGRMSLILGGPSWVEIRLTKEETEAVRRLFSPRETEAE
jgi:hypothetical protein